MSGQTWRRMAARGMLTVVVSAGVTLGWIGPQAVHAAASGVQLADAVYVRVHDAALTTAGDNATLRFSVDVVNDGGGTVDYNRYGIRIADADGGTYTAELSEKASARVGPHRTQTYKYTAVLPIELTADSINMDVFAWELSGDGYLRELGMLSLTEAIASGTSAQGEVAVNLHEVDGTMPNDAIVNFQMERSYRVLTNGTWCLYADVRATNNGASSVKLPQALQFAVRDGASLMYPAVAAYGGDQAILPRQSVLLTLQAQVGAADPASVAGLELLERAAGADAVALGTLELSGTGSVIKPGETAGYGPDGLSLAAGPVIYADKPDGMHVDAAVTLTNKGSAALAVPALSGLLQMSQSALTAAAAEGSGHPAFLSPGESTTFHYSAVYPKGVPSGTVQLALWEKKAAAVPVSTPAAVIALPEKSTGTPSGEGNGLTTIVSPVGKLAVSLKTVNRLQTETGEDVIVAEVQVKNLENKIVQLPSLYGGIANGDIDLSGKTIRLQSSPFLNPNQSTSLYVYAKLPYSLDFHGGFVYFGDGQYNAATAAWSQTREWAELAYASAAGTFTPVAAGTEWFVPDAGRQSTGRIVDSRTYTVGSQTMLAVRILQTNKEVRGGTVVPYTGYASGPDGSAFTLKTTDQPGKLGKDGAALTTLWTTLPDGADPTNLSFVFGHKLDDQTFAGVQQFAFAPSAGNGSLNQCFLYPFTVSVANTKMKLGSSGKYEISFDYTQTKAVDTAGAAKNRALRFEAVDGAGKSVKTWDSPLEGAGALSSGSTNILYVELSAIPDMASFVLGGKLNVYETFEGGTRLLGTAAIGLF